MPVLAVIPARFASSRLPGKPLLRDTGKYLIEHVWERCRAARGLDRVVIATDDDRIAAAAASFGAEAVMTSADHPSGTDRVAEVARETDAQVIVNVQGDEPDVAPDDLDELVAALTGSGAELSTLATPIPSRTELLDPHTVKVVVDGQGRALYFSRSPIPHGASATDASPPALKHRGLYAYQRSALLRLASEPPVPLEQLERLEQLRALHHGMRIQVAITPRDGAGIDTPEDYRRFVEGS